jgi:nitrous oxide reductase accessory protein NosL
VRTRYRLAVALTVSLLVGGCSGTERGACDPPAPSRHIAVGASQRMTINAGAAPYFNNMYWGQVSPSRFRDAVTLQGTMALWRRDVAVFRSDDGQTLTFRRVVCA